MANQSVELRDGAKRDSVTVACLANERTRVSSATGFIAFAFVIFSRRCAQRLGYWSSHAIKRIVWNHANPQRGASAPRTLNTFRAINIECACAAWVIYAAGLQYLM